MHYLAPAVIILGISAALYKTKNVWKIEDYKGEFEGSKTNQGAPTWGNRDYQQWNLQGHGQRDFEPGLDMYRSRGLDDNDRSAISVPTTEQGKRNLVNLTRKR